MALGNGLAVTEPFNSHCSIINWSQSSFKVGGLTLLNGGIPQGVSELGSLRSRQLFLCSLLVLGFQVFDLLQSFLMVTVQQEALAT